MKTTLAYLGVVLIWATTPLAIQWSGQTDWFFGIAGRILISAVLIIPILLWMTRQPIALNRDALKLYFYASLGMLGGMTPMYYAAQTMPSGWISLIFGSTPIVTGLLAYWLLKSISLDKAKLAGIAISFTGLAVIFVPKLVGSDTIIASEQLALGIGLALLGVFFHSLSTLLVKKNQGQIPNTHVVAGSLWITAVIYLIAKPHLLTDWPEMQSQSWLAIIYLGVFGSLVGFILYYYVLKRIDAVKIGLITLITPVIALLLGYFFNNEPLSLGIALGAVLVILGLVLFEFGHKLSKDTLKLLASRML